MDIVYFSSVSGQTHKFVGKLDGYTAYRLPLRKTDPEVHVSAPYVLVTPTYGAGRGHKSVPPQVIQFLNDSTNRSLLRGVVAGGNRNYGAYFGHAADVISEKCEVPILGKFEITGFPGDAETIMNRIENIEQQGI